MSISQPLVQDLEVKQDPRTKKFYAQYSRAAASWFTEAWQILFAVSQSGTTANRPTTNLFTGRPYFDTTLGIPIWWDGAIWIDASGVPA